MDNDIPHNKCVEKLLADLESGMGAILKKAESSLESTEDKSGIPPTLPLLESEVHTIYKFIGLAGFRNGPLGLSCSPGDAHSSESSQGGYREGWVKQLEFLLKNSHKDLAEKDELLQAEILRPTLARYKQLSTMKLLFWTTSVGEEFLLSNFLTGLEGYQFPDDEMSPKKSGMPAHVFLPMGPKVLLVLCSDSLCQKSLLYDAPHGIATPYDRPAKGKLCKTEGPKRYQPVVPNWKTIYPITLISEKHLNIINSIVLGLSSAIVYKSESTLEKTVDNIVPFSEQYAAWRTAISCNSESIKDEERTAVAESCYNFLKVLQMCNREHLKNYEEEIHEEVMQLDEEMEKLLFYTLCQDSPTYLLPILCRSSEYYMGTSKQIED